MHEKHLRSPPQALAAAAKVPTLHEEQQLQAGPPLLLRHPVLSLDPTHFTRETGHYPWVSDTQQGW